MKKFLLVLCFIFMAVIRLYSQDLLSEPPGNWTGFLHFESGCIYPDGTIKESLAIRQNISSYYVDQATNGHISSETSGYIFGVRWEYFNHRLKSGFSTGLRFTNWRSFISGYSSSNSGFFYLRYSMDNTDTKFARVRSIAETNNYISIPLEFRIIPFQVKDAGLFAKAGAELSLLNLKNETDIKFQESSMEAYQDEVLNSIGITTNKLWSSLYVSAGIKFGQENKPNYIIEVFLPSIFLSKDNFTLTDVEYYQGFKFSVQFPLKKQN